MSLIGFFRKGLARHILSLILFLHFLNISVDPVDTTPHHLPEDLTINEIESITELIAESIFGLDNFFGESDEADPDKTSGCNLYFVLNDKLSNSIFERPEINNKPTTLVNQDAILTPMLAISTPPPRIS